ncbi:MAG: type II secretion system F family protein [Dactylosporangium sp.]|nr:type II secretion system F family protein [Dactylosporangium sp.]NNJ63502.1 type II secretion system F family protein [Dactylosporangium sp.]
MLATGGAVLGVSAVVGTTRPPAAPSPVRRWLVRQWHGDGRGRRQRRTRQTLLVAAAVAGAVGWLTTGMPIAGALVAVAVPGTPWLLAVGRAEQRTIARIEAVGEWTRRLKDICGTGVGLQQAIVASTATCPSGISAEVATLAARLQAGWHAPAALRMLADDIADPVCDQVVAALMLHLSDRGEDLGEVLTAIAAASAAEVATRREVDAKRTQPRFAVRFLTGMTVLTVGYAATRPDYMRPYATTTGQMIMFGLGAVFVGLLVWVRSMSLPPRVPRLLAAAPDQEVSP